MLRELDAVPYENVALEVTAGGIMNWLAESGPEGMSISDDDAEAMAADVAGVLRDSIWDHDSTREAYHQAASDLSSEYLVPDRSIGGGTRHR